MTTPRPILIVEDDAALRATLAEQIMLAGEFRIVEAENAAISRWAAPVSGTYVEKSNEAARDAEKTREAVAAARRSATERQ